MAKKKKQEEAAKGSPAWMATFSDLMNLLLCFFVLLFSMSSVDVEKYNQLVASLSNSFGIMTGGESIISEGELISSGISQLNQLDQYFTNMGEPVEENDGDELEDPMEQIRQENEKLTGQLYNEVNEKVEEKKIEDYVEIDYDRQDFQYVQISLNGSILFDSGMAEIKKESLKVFSKVGDILKSYDNCQIEIEGHTDNVPINNSKFKNNNWLSSSRALNVAEYLINEKGLNPATLKYSGRGEYNPIASNKTAEGRAKNRRVEIKIYNSLNSK